MSGKQEKRLRREGKVISIAARRDNAAFERRIAGFREELAEQRGERRHAGRVVLAVVSLALIAFGIAKALGF